jgi:hypothetical protein
MYQLKCNSFDIKENYRTNPSTHGSGLNVSRLIPMTLMMVLIAATPSHPDFRATLAG